MERIWVRPAHIATQSWSDCLWHSRNCPKFSLQCPHLHFSSIQSKFRRLPIPQQTLRRIFAFFALAFATGSIAFAKSSTAPVTLVTPPKNTWEYAQSVGSSKGTLFVVTKDEPNRRQTCHLQPFNTDELVCSRAIGGPRTYLRQQVVALILPGDQHPNVMTALRVFGFGEFGAAIWGSVVLAATCPACAVGAGIGAFIYFGFAERMVGDDGRPDRLLYLAPGQRLTGKLASIKI